MILPIISIVVGLVLVLNGCYRIVFPRSIKDIMFSFLSVIIGTVGIVVGGMIV